MLNIVQMSVANTTIINQELENTINVGQFEGGVEFSIFVGQSGADEWINADKLKLKVFSIEWDPFSVFQFFDVDFIVLNLICINKD